MIIRSSFLLLALGLLLLAGCSCGFDCNNEDSKGTTLLRLGFSDALPEALKQVVIEVDSITFSRTGFDDVVVDRFTIPQLGLLSVDTFQMDLLHFRGRNQLLVIDELELQAGSYSQLSIRILGHDVNRSYVQEADDSLKELSVTGATLHLPGVRFGAGDQSYTVEFSLAQSLRTTDAGASYLMTTTGIRLQDNTTAASLSGRVDSSLFDTVTPCSEKTEPTSGNRIYLYQGSVASGKRLGDVYTAGSSSAIPDHVVPPFAVASLLQNTLTANWEYVFGFLPAGDYTLALACNTAGDDSVNYDDLTVPLPSDQLYPIKLSAGVAKVCDLKPGAGC